MESGIYIRVGTKNILLEDLNEEQRMEWLNNYLEKDGLIRTINRLCDCLQQYKNNEDDPDYEDYMED